MPATLGRVTALILALSVLSEIHAQDLCKLNLDIFEFGASCYTHLGRCHLKGLMTTDGTRSRIAVYWTEPGGMRDDSTFFVSCCDILLTEEGVHSWIYGVSEPWFLSWSDCADAHFLPRREDTTSVVQSALGIVYWLYSESEAESDPLHLGRFLQDSRVHPGYTYRYTPNEEDKTDLCADTVADRQILNALPLGRQYIKKTMEDGTLQWRLVKALDKKPIMQVTVKQLVKGDSVVASCPFDVKTLGHWRLIPEPYRVYWVLRAACAELGTSTKPGTKGIDVCNRIETYLRGGPMSDQVRRALERLWFDTALVAGNISHVRQSLEAVVAGFCGDDTVSNERAFLELGTIAAELESHHPQQFRAVLEPCIVQVVNHAKQDMAESFRKLTKTIVSHEWFSYGDLLLEAIRRLRVIENVTAQSLAINYQAARQARKTEPFDRSQFCVTVREYLALLDTGPPPGILTTDEVRYILEQGLNRHYIATDFKTRCATIENIVKSLCLIAGDGPFRGNQARLIESIERFSKNYFVVCRNTLPIDTALATFLALAFYDISTPRDRDALCAQIAELCSRFQSHVNARLSAHAIDPLVTPDDVRGIFAKYYDEAFRSHVEDPLCPTFKFPLTPNEEVRLVNQLILRFDRLESLFEEMSLKVKYGGISPELKEAAIRRISPAVQNLLPSTAFLRRPSFPGVVYQYRGRHGFSAVIPNTLYREGERPKKRFQAMQYFHLGHRLEDVVKREQEIENERTKQPGRLN